MHRLAGDLDAARTALAEAESFRAAVAAGPDSELGRAVSRLRLALDPFPPESQPPAPIFLYASRE